MGYIPPRGPKRGVSIYSYSDLFVLGLTLEDCFLEMQDMGAHGVEILANSHIDGYPELTDAFLEKWHGLCEKYEIIPAEYGHWIDGRMWKDRMLTVDECVKYLENDFRIAHELGFRCLRTKQTVINGVLDPVENWRDIITAATPAAEKYDVVMLPEIHAPTLLNQRMVQDFVEYIDKTGTKAFGLNIDFGVFSVRQSRTGEIRYSKPEEIIPLLPYVKCCHAKYTKMVPDEAYGFREENIPYPEILAILKKHEWDGWMVAEYEGFDDRGDENALSEALRQHQILMKNCLGY